MAKIQNTDNTKYLEGSVQEEVSFSTVRNAERQVGVVEMQIQIPGLPHMKKQSSWKGSHSPHT